ncbi:hypothetical protein M0813_12701 [Anaeramoeba flamelloides]|uniref:Uncharacterized protein n=1 Tax=Anaeramoeba flamelloides TaxID=1746091 RepID=A0ABQ8ZBJ4_9EUKA|nr:hypothetical protein M0813_12701 [Anaeramoeba flamelloides]
MKLAIVFLALLIISAVYSCKNSKSCETKDKPVCNGDKCVECTSAVHCSIDSWCDKDKYECKKYSDEDVFGKFCNSQNCTENSVAKVCGGCGKDNQENWVGACINFKCEACSLDYSTWAANSIVAQHEGNAGCFAKGTSGAAGYISSIQYGGQTPAHIRQDATGIGFMCIGFVFFFFLVVQCITYIRMNK